MQYLLLLLWTLTAFVSCQENTFPISVIKTVTGIKLTCKDYHMQRSGRNNISQIIELNYEDDNSGEYECVDPTEGTAIESPKIYVKFRTCENCVEIDTASLTGVIIGNVLVTVLVGVAVHFFAAEVRSSQVTSNKKTANKQRNVPGERSGRDPNDQYQALRPRNVQKRDEYDMLNVNRR